MWKLLIPACIGSLLSGCAELAPTDRALGQQSGLLVENIDAPAENGVYLRIKGGAWLFGGEASNHFRREAEAWGRKQGCPQFHLKGLRESQENTWLGTRRVMEGWVICDVALPRN